MSRKKPSSRGVAVLGLVVALAAALWWVQRGASRSASGPVLDRPAPAPAPSPELPAVARVEPPPPELREPGKATPTAQAAGAAPARGAAQSKDQRPMTFTLVARVTALDGLPLVGAEVRLLGERRLASTDAEGRVRAVLELPRDEAWRMEGWDGTSCSFVVVAPGYAAEILAAEPVEGTELNLGTVRLEPGGEAEGVVLDEAGAPLEGAWVGALLVGEDAGLERGSLQDRLLDEIDFGYSFAPTTRSQEGGRFLLQGLPAGEMLLVAGAPGRTLASCAPFALLVGQRVERTLLLAAPQAERLRIAGRVVDAEHRPLAGCRVSAETEAGDGATGQVDERYELDELGYGALGYNALGYAATLTDEAGRFALELEVERGQPRRLSLSAVDPEARGYPVTLAGLAPEGGPFELVLGAARMLTLRLVDPEGQPAPWCHLRWRGANGDPSWPRELTPLGAAGQARFLLPLEPFELEGMGPGFRGAALGRFVPSALGAELVLTLQRGEAVRGRVLFAGTPLAGAHLALHPASTAQVFRSSSLAPLDRPFLAHGLLEPNRRDATTDGEGRFTLSLPRSGPYVISASATGYPWTVFGPFEWELERGAEGLELTLQPAGALEGRVLVPPGASPERLVGAAGGWSVAWTTSADEQGRYRIEGLAPGRYQVRPCLPPAASRQVFQLHGREPELVFDCVVQAGETTRFDLDLRGEEDFVLAGRLALPPLQGTWEAALMQVEGPEAFRLPIAQAPLDAEGRFRLTLARGGSVQLVLSGGSGVFEQTLELAPGHNEWSATPAWGSLRLLPPSRAPAAPGWRSLSYRWQDGHGLSFTLQSWSQTSDDTGLGPFAVPAGKGALTFEERPAGRLERELEVPAGEELLVELAQPR